MLRNLAFAVLIAACSTGSSEADAPKPAAMAQRDQRVTPRRTVKPADAVLRKELTHVQYEVTQNNGTEMPFENAYWDNHAAGIYVDVVTGEPLFSSTHKFDSGTGWPSFYKPIGDIVEKRDSTHGMTRVEVRSKIADSHLGHVFDDGPKPSGQRYCINSASLDFQPGAAKGK